MIKSSRLWLHPNIIWTIIKKTPTLDPLVILLNTEVYYIENKKEIASFATIKKWKDSTEIGTIYTYPKYRNKGLAGLIIKSIKKEYSPIWLLCKKELVSYYKKQGFKTIKKANNKGKEFSIKLLGK